MHAGVIGPLNAGPHGFTEIFYGLASQWNNNGSAFGGLTGATNFYDLVGGIAMALGRFPIIIPSSRSRARWRSSRPGRSRTPCRPAPRSSSAC